MLHVERIIVLYAATLLQTRKKKDRGEERIKLLGVGVEALMRRSGRWLRGHCWKEWWSTLVTGEEKEFCRGEKERDVRGGYFITGEGMGWRRRLSCAFSRWVWGGNGWRGHKERKKRDRCWLEKKRGEKPDFWPTLDLILFMLRPWNPPLFIGGERGMFFV